MFDPKMPRGIRNCNAGNIRMSSIRWQGLRPSPTDTAFAEFVTPVYGVRALMKVLLTYYRKYGLDTVQSIINRWAPPIENATDHYAHHVAMRLKVKRHQTLDVTDKGTLISLAKAIVVHENGWAPRGYPKHWYEDALYEDAYKLIN